MFSSMFRQLIQLMTWFIVIAPWEQAIRIRMGKRRRLLEPGFYIRIPFIDRIFKQSVRRRLHIITPQTLTTRDGKIVICGGAVGFSITDLFKLYDTLESPNDTIANEVAGIVAEFIGAHRLEECRVRAIEEFVMGKLDLSRYGLSGQEFILTQFAVTRAYRFITGEIPGYSRDCQMTMSETMPSGPS